MKLKQIIELSEPLHYTKLLRFLQTNIGWIDYEKVLETQYSKVIQPRSTVIDIGAHLGRHTAVFSSLVGRKGQVVAIEPILPIFKQLKQRDYPHSNIVFYNQAITPKAGKFSFVYARGTPEESGLRKRKYNSPDQANPITVKVTGVPLDDVLKEIRKVDYIKVDVEGAEIDVLKSGLSSINRDRPIISVEYGFPSYSVYGHEKATLFELAQDMHYVISDLFGNVISSPKVWERICDYAYWDYFLIPKENEKNITSKLKI